MAVEFKLRFAGFLDSGLGDRADEISFIRFDFDLIPSMLTSEERLE